MVIIVLYYSIVTKVDIVHNILINLYINYHTFYYLLLVIIFILVATTCWLLLASMKRTTTCFLFFFLVVCSTMTARLNNHTARNEGPAHTSTSHTARTKSDVLPQLSRTSHQPHQDGDQYTRPPPPQHHPTNDIMISPRCDDHTSDYCIVVPLIISIFLYSRSESCSSDTTNRTRCDVIICSHNLKNYPLKIQHHSIILSPVVVVIKKPRHTLNYATIAAQQ